MVLKINFKLSTKIYFILEGLNLNLIKIYILDHLESPGEKLKTEHVAPWLEGVIQNHPQVLVSCLLPHPPEYARVGGHWYNLFIFHIYIKASIPI